MRIMLDRNLAIKHHGYEMYLINKNVIDKLHGKAFKQDPNDCFNKYRRRFILGGYAVKRSWCRQVK